MTGYTRDKTAAYALGVGTMGVIAGFGIGGKPNTLALLVGVGSLAYANYLSNLVQIQASPRIARRARHVRQQAPGVVTRTVTSVRTPFLY
jgi:hypothetical protein